MEEILVIVLQVTLELAVELLAYGGADFFAALSFGRAERKESSGCGVVLLFGFLGAGMGGIANLIWPRQLLPEAWMRIANMIVGPLIAGAASYVVADLRQRHGATIRPGLHFTMAFLFVISFDVVRFIYAHH
jgi:hypothetical protein